jgi:hypothetical protein
LEDRTVPSSASLIGFNGATGDWKTASLDANGVVQVANSAHWDPFGLTAVVHGDFTGDGQVDVAGWNKLGYWLVGVGNGNQFQTEQWSVGFGQGIKWSTFLVGDFNGDGKDDVAMFAPNGQWWVALSTGTSFQIQRWDQPGDWLPAGNWRSWQVGDFNGDGRADIAGLSRSGGWQVGVSTGSSFVAQSWLATGSWAGVQAKSVVAGDFNGDGSTDLAGRLTNGQWYVALSTGDFFASAAWTATQPAPKHLRLFQAGDFNGDGLADVAAMDSSGRVWVFSSTGSAFNVAVWAGADPQGLRARQLDVGDFDGDGTDDVAVLDRAGTWSVGLSTGTDFVWSASAAFGGGRWANTFSSDQAEPDRLVNRHHALHGNSAASYIAPQDLRRLRIDPSYFATIFQAYQYRLRQQLGPKFSGLGEDGLAFCLATIVAYQAADYGVFPRPTSDNLSALLAVHNLVCNEYCLLATELYRVAMPVADDPGTTITMLGFGSGPFGDHAQLVFSDGSTSILGDPTLGLVALTDYASLRKAVPVPSWNIRQLIDRTESSASLQTVMVNFRSLVYTALISGEYPEESVLYIRNVTELT